MDSFQTIIVLMFAATILVGLSRKIDIPYPIGLVIGGIALGLTPINLNYYFDPNLVLTIVLPPILYYAAFGISFREFKKNIRYITSLALGLVVCTTLVVGLIFKWIFPEFPWALAFIFGAIISPPDAVAATSILKRFAISSRLLTILEGESLVNDASALVLYRLGVTALLSGAFSFFEGAADFAISVTGGIALGLLLGFLTQRFSRNYLEPVVGIVFSFTIPYITFITATKLGVSGVLAVVVNGLLGSYLLHTHRSSLRRIIGYATWDIFIILMNCFVFILIGLNLRTILSSMSDYQLILYTGYAFLIFFAMIAVRTLWIYIKNGIAYYKALHSPNAKKICPQLVRETVLIGWCGMRGIVSLAAALAIPYGYPDGTLLDGREEVIFITFIVVMLTLLIPGLTLSRVIKMLNIHSHDEEFNLLGIRQQLAIAAREAVNELHVLNKINDEELHFFVTHADLQLKAFEISSTSKPDSRNFESVRDRVIQAQRRKLLQLWEEQKVDDRLLRQLEHELDLEEVHMARAELK